MVIVLLVLIFCLVVYIDVVWWLRFCFLKKKFELKAQVKLCLFYMYVTVIETIVKGLTSNNENQVQDAMVKADQIISAKHCRPSSKEDEEQHMMKTTIG